MFFLPFSLSEERREFEIVREPIFVLLPLLPLFYFSSSFSFQRMQMQNALCTIYVRAILLLLPTTVANVASILGVLKVAVARM